MSFRVAGLKILQGCAPYIRKRLKEGELYLFSSRYVKNAENELILSLNRGEERNLFADSLYDIQSDTHPIEITVSAIVCIYSGSSSAIHKGCPLILCPGSKDLKTRVEV